MIVIAAMADSGNHAGNGIWPSLETASRIFDLSSFALIGGLVVGAIATVLIVWMGIVKEHHWDVLREQSNEKVAGLELETAKAKAELGTAQADIAKANAEIATAHEGAAKANERAAALENDAAGARLETEKLKQVVAWRSISPQDATSMETVLALKPGAVNLRWMDGDPEALYFAMQISWIFEKARWQIAPGAIKPANTILFGVNLSDAAGSDSVLVRTALGTARVQYSEETVPAAGVSFSLATIPGAPTLTVGSRSPPQIR